MLHVSDIVFESCANHDVAQYLTAGREWINGASLYVDVVDNNPPMIYCISGAASIFSSIFTLPPWLGGLLFMMVLGMLSGIFAVLLLGKSLPLKSIEVLFPLAFFVSISQWTYVRGDFGQREHLVSLFLLPFCIVRFCRYQGLASPPGYMAVIAGVLDFLALALKIFYILPIVAAE
jgi:hypothetical protein